MNAMDRPTVREFKRQISRQRYQRRLAKAPYYRLALLSLLIVACVALAVLSLVLQTHSVASQGR